MLQSVKRIILAGLMLAPASLVQGFSLLGPLNANPWQVSAIGYQLAGDIGGPMNIGAEYRYNNWILTYAFDQSFLNYFGQQGVEAVQQGINMIHALPPVSDLSPNLTEFPTENKRLNSTAQALGIMDLSSVTGRLLLELLGLAEPERWTWCLRSRVTRTIGNVTYTNYAVFQRNFDPVTFQPTNQVNNAFYFYTIDEPLAPGDYADALEYSLDPVQLQFTSVAGGYLSPGWLYPGLTRDDVGGLRYLWRAKNYNVETLSADVSLPPGYYPTNLIPSVQTLFTNSPLTSPWMPYIGYSNNAGGTTNLYITNIPPWLPWLGLTNNSYLTNYITNFFGTNINLTNLLINAALRPGIEKVFFIPVQFDSLLGQAFVPITNVYEDVSISNSTRMVQVVQRVISQPDLIFLAEDLGVNNNGFPYLTGRTRTTVNNDTINGRTAEGGPGLIEGPMTITFTDILPYWINVVGPGSGLGDWQGPFTYNQSVVWGHFDATPTPPIVFPNRYSLEQLENWILGY